LEHDHRDKLEALARQSCSNNKPERDKLSHYSASDEMSGHPVSDGRYSFIAPQQGRNDWTKPPRNPKSLQRESPMHRSAAS
jgi:hypothetical protein